MKKLLITLSIASLVTSCSKKENGNLTENSIDSTKIIDSINTVRTRINDSIRNKNRFDLLTGTYTLKHDMIDGKGKVTFIKVNGNNDEYEVKGNLKGNKNYLSINGFAIRVSPKHFNFTGIISQSIQENNGGKIYTRNNTKTFMTKDGGKTWALQDQPNPSGFIDKIEFIK